MPQRLALLGKDSVTSPPAGSLWPPAPAKVRVTELQLVPGDLPAKALITGGMERGGDGDLPSPSSARCSWFSVSSGKKFTGCTTLPCQRTFPLGLLVMRWVYYYAHQVIGCANSGQFGRGLRGKSVQLIRLYNPKWGTLNFRTPSFEP